MSKKPLMPAISNELRSVGERIRLARLRRNLSQELLSERAGISRPTLSGIEQGDPGVSIGAYASVLKVMSLAKDLSKVAADDELGRKLQDLNLDTPRNRTPRKMSP